ncbi:nucleotide exchange factor GrpE [Nitratifractor salsuginis]|uniref:Protein GrpE n=1 Tax=Nitratifractor salsuginis (strain DSM 16511 / JCM 12458 / E9I37-1) TaxID=749222 RepID=E6X0M1_NITSE|nr:nucleotide exchange factor GrpE [Nitratifractor salsuginis]ADV45741.1 GrpE protein [Nitratifractor salsuginis DSM 16511]
MSKKNKRPEESEKKLSREEEKKKNESQEPEELEEFGCEEKLADCQKEVEEYKDRYLRAHADFENMKKRLEKDKSTAVMYANEAFATDLLSVIDTFENALASIDKIQGDEAVEKIKEGIALTYEQLLKVLKKHGVEEIANEGVFDPHVHQVVQQVESDAHEQNEIVHVLQKGYKLRDRVLRPSMVSTKK